MGCCCGKRCSVKSRGKNRTNNEWILFKYFPKYLKNPKFRSLICDNQNICKELGIKYSYINLILDGGSVVYQDDLYFVSERILSDNHTLSKTQIIKNLEEIFKTEKIILIPEMSNDFTGHLDGVMTILDYRTILINNFQNPYKDQINSILQKNKFNIEILSYNPYSNKTYHSAKGIYINYIKTDKLIFAPIFKQNEDELVLSKLQLLYPSLFLIPILCSDLAKAGGLLHCVSWEI